VGQLGKHLIEVLVGLPFEPRRRMWQATTCGSTPCSQQAIRDLAGAMRDLTGNLPMLAGVFPDYSAPIVRTAVDGVRELAMARRGMPSPTFAIAGKKTDPGVTNIRNVKSPHWRRWLGVECRCIVPFTSFAENEVFAGWLPCGYGSRSTIAARSPFFPGIWTRWMPAPVEDALGIAGAARHIKDRACAARVPSQRVTFAGSGVTIYKRGLTATGKSIF
jgi:hypothetical protein